jgi:O-antigen ligase
VAAVGCLVLGVAVLAGTAALGLPLLAPAAALALLAVPLLLVRPVAVLVLATVAEFANLSTVAAGNGLPGGETAALVFSALAALLAWRRGQIRPGWSPLVVVVLLYLLAQTVSALANQTIDPSLTAAAASETNLTAVLETAKALLWPLVAGMLLLIPGRVPEAMARAIALTLAVLAALTMFQEFALGNGTSLAGLSNVPLVADVGGATARHAGPQGDANFWGRVLVLGLPFALSLAQMARRTGAKLGWLAAAAAICGGIVLTGSRGALLAAFLVGLVWALLAGGRWAKAVLFAPVVGALALFVPGVGSRLATLSLLGTSDSLEVVDPSLEGRLAAQRVALEVLVDHPVLGVGPGNFLAVTQDYLSRLGLDTLPLAPHNQYLEAAAEGGLLGLTAWLLVLGGGILVALRARLLARSGGPAVAREAPLPLSNAVLAALAGWAVASVFLHLATFRTFLFVLALGAALDIRARRRVEELRLQPDLGQSAGGGPLTTSATRTGSGRGRRLRYAAAGLAGLLVLGAAALWNAAGPQERTWSASSSMQLVSVDEGGRTRRPTTWTRSAAPVWSAPWPASWPARASPTRAWPGWRRTRSTSRASRWRSPGRCSRRSSSSPPPARTRTWRGSSRRRPGPPHPASSTTSARCTASATWPGRRSSRSTRRPTTAAGHWCRSGSAHSSPACPWCPPSAPTAGRPAASSGDRWCRRRGGGAHGVPTAQPPGPPSAFPAATGTSPSPVLPNASGRRAPALLRRTSSPRW